MDKYPATTNMHNFDHSHTKMELNFVVTEGMKNMLALTTNSSTTSEVTVNIHSEFNLYTSKRSISRKEVLDNNKEEKDSNDPSNRKYGINHQTSSQQFTILLQTANNM